MDFMLIFDIIIMLLGGYIVYSAFKMRKNQEVGTLFVASQEMAHCHDPKGFIEFLFPKALIFGAVSLFFGIVNLIDDLLISIGAIGNMIVMVAFIAAWLWFSQILRKGRKEFF